MAATTMTHARPLAGGTAASLIAVIGDALRAARKSHARRRAMRELGSLDDWMLKDIGFNRSEIESITRGADPTRLAR